MIVVRRGRALGAFLDKPKLRYWWRIFFDAQGGVAVVYEVRTSRILIEAEVEDISLCYFRIRTLHASAVFWGAWRT